GRMRELRAADGIEARAVWPISGMYRVPRMQDDPEDTEGRSNCGARRRPGGGLSEVRREPCYQARTLRPVHGMLKLSKVQIHQAGDDRRVVSRLRRRHSGQAWKAQDLLRLL